MRRVPAVPPAALLWPEPARTSRDSGTGPSPSMVSWAPSNWPRTTSSSVMCAVRPTTAWITMHARRMTCGPRSTRCCSVWARGRALESPRLRARRRVLAENQLRPWRAHRRGGRADHARGALGLEPRQDAAPRNAPGSQPGELAPGRPSGAPDPAGIATGHRERPQGFQADSPATREASARGRAVRAERLQDSAYRAAFRDRVSLQGWAGAVHLQDAAARTSTCAPPGSVRGYGVLCSAACREQWTQQRGRGRDGRPWQEVADSLRRLGPALDGLAAPAPEIVVAFLWPAGWHPLDAARHRRASGPQHRPGAAGAEERAACAADRRAAATAGLSATPDDPQCHCPYQFTLESHPGLPDCRLTTDTVATGTAITSPSGAKSQTVRGGKATGVREKSGVRE